MSKFAIWSLIWVGISFGMLIGAVVASPAVYPEGYGVAALVWLGVFVFTLILYAAYSAGKRS